MVELARAKVGDAAELSVADMRELPDFGQFDLVWCLDDAINYLLSGEELEQALGGMRRNLGPGGLLMFDVNASAYRTFFAEECVVDATGGGWSGRGARPPTPRRGRSSKPASKCCRPGRSRGRAADRPEMHRQRHFPEAEVLAGLESAGLGVPRGLRPRRRRRPAPAAAGRGPQQGRLHRRAAA